jgi:4-amino-4-deoxy-L-arabinose transferase-like glycosyltransferase
MEKEDILNKRLDKIKSWIKNPYNLTLVAILAFAIIIRIYYYFLTQGQAVWWDAAEYMNMARAWAFGIDYKFLPVRPVLFSLIIAGFLKISNTEILPRLLIFLLSIASIYGMYLFGKEVYGKKIGLICAFFTSVFYLHIFHTYRLLVDLPSFTFFVFAGVFFYKYFKDNSNKKALYIGAVIIAIGTLFRITTAILLFAILIYVLVTEKLNCLKKKEYWIAALIFMLILSPYIIWGYLQFNGFVITQAGAWNAPDGNYLLNGLWNLKSYISLFPSMFSWIFLTFFILGSILMYKLILGFDLLLKGKEPELKKYLFLFLIIIIPILTVSFSINHYFEDRYVMNSLPGIFIVTSHFIIIVYKLIKSKSKLLAVIFLIFLLGSIGYIQLNHANDIINSRKDSYLHVKQAGLWLKQNSNEKDIILTRSHPLIKYYSEREVIDIPKEEEINSIISSNQSIKFYIASIFENHENWMYAFPLENNLTAVQAYFMDSAKEQPSLIIYKLQ